MKKLLEFLQDESGMFSSYRLVFVLWAFSLTGLWTILSLLNKTILPVDPSLITLTGIFVAGKISQSFSENYSKK